MFLGLRTVIYRIGDHERGRDYYAAAFGVQPYFDQPYYIGFQINGFELALDPDMSDGPIGPGGSVAYWRVDAIKPAFDRFIELGGTAVKEPYDIGGGIVGIVADPFGNLIGLVQEPDKAAD